VVIYALGTNDMIRKIYYQ